MIRSVRKAFLSILATAVVAKAATISGTVTVRGATDPIAGVKIVLISQKGPIDSTITDAKGMYTLDSATVGFRTITAAKDGYQTGTGNVNVAAANGTYTVNIALTPTNTGAQTGTIAGTVTDSGKAGIANATVILSHGVGRNGPTPIDTVVTDADGRFVFAAVQPANNYILTASAAKYVTGNGTANVTGGDTAKPTIVLVKQPEPTSSVVGTVTDAASKAALSGAKVILRKRVQSGLTLVWQSIDSTLSAGDGAFAFTNIAASTQFEPYSLVISKTDYNTATSANIVVADGKKDTTNVALTKVAKGSLSVFVGFDSTGNAALAGASVTASLQTQGGDVYTGTTDAKGWATFADVIAGDYVLTANLSGYLTKSGQTTVAMSKTDTVKILLARATANNSKTLSGLVRDEAGKAVSGATVTFEASNNRGVIISTKTSATGDYAFDGIPTNVTGGTVTVQMTGYADFTGPVTLSGAQNFLNVTLKKPVSISALGPVNSGIRLIWNGSGAELQLPASSASGTVSAYSIQGALVHVLSIPAGLSQLALPASWAQGHAVVQFLVVKQGASVSRLILPSAR